MSSIINESNPKSKINVNSDHWGQISRGEKCFSREDQDRKSDFSKAIPKAKRQ